MTATIGLVVHAAGKYNQVTVEAMWFVAASVCYGVCVCVC